MYLAQNNKVLSSALESRFNLLLILKRQKYEEFALARKQRRINPITLRKEPYITLSQRLPRQFFSFTFLIFSVLLVLGAVISGTFSDQALHGAVSLSMLSDNQRVSFWNVVFIRTWLSYYLSTCNWNNPGARLNDKRFRRYQFHWIVSQSQYGCIHHSFMHFIGCYHYIEYNLQLGCVGSYRIWGPFTRITRSFWSFWQISGHLWPFDGHYNLNSSWT